MSIEPPEFHTKTLSPLSPLPVYLPEPSNIPVLRNQIDPIFNMTSTHIVPTMSDPDPLQPQPTESNPQIDSFSDTSSFSDAYNEPAGEKEIPAETKDASINVSDDYAMTFDSEGEDQGDIQDVSHEITASNMAALPEPVQDPELSPTAVSHDVTATESPELATQSKPLVAHSATTDAPPNIPPTLPANVSEQNSLPKAPSYEEVANGDIDIQQLLDNITAQAEKNEASTPTQSLMPSLPKGNGLPAHASLPPRPQVPQKRPYQDDFQKYHTTGILPPSSSLRAPGVPSSLVAAGAPGTSTDPRGGLPPPPSANFGGPPPSLVSPITPASYSQMNQSSGQDRLTKSIETRDEADDVEQRWGPDVQKIYDIFLDEERKNVTEGLWDRFPLGSRLFIGNLPSEKVTKRDLFHVFHKYGRLAQVSIKQAYGFIQFHDSPACYEALKFEQGSEVRGRKMHLEISKPQKNTNNNNNNNSNNKNNDAGQRYTGAAGQRRSRSPDYSRGGNMSGRQGRQSNDNRNDTRAQPKVRVDEYGRVLRSPLRVRDDYRPRRSISPYRGNTRGEREYFEARNRDSYGRDRGRDRSRSPYEQNGGRYRDRSPSPRTREANADADLQIPRRDPRNVPDVQIILLEQLDRNFVSWVESEIGSRGIKTEVMFLNSRLPLETVVRRQIIEGVHAVAKLDITSQNASKIPLQVFDRQSGANNVRWDEYRDLEPKIAGELVLRAKQTQAQPQAAPPQYPQQQYAPPQAQAQAYQQPVAAQPAPSLANIVGQLDNATLQKLLGSLNIPQPNAPAPAPAANAPIDLASLLGGLQQHQAPNLQQAYQPPIDPYAIQQPTNPGLAALLGNGAALQPSPTPVQGQQSAQQVQNIMAQLAKYRQ